MSSLLSFDKLFELPSIDLISWTDVVQLPLLNGLPLFCRLMMISPKLSSLFASEKVTILDGEDVSALMVALLKP